MSFTDIRQIGWRAPGLEAGILKILTKILPTSSFSIVGSVGSVGFLMTVRLATMLGVAAACAGYMPLAKMAKTQRAYPQRTNVPFLQTDKTDETIKVFQSETTMMALLNTMARLEAKINYLDAKLDKIGESSVTTGWMTEQLNGKLDALGEMLSSIMLDRQDAGSPP